MLAGAPAALLTARSAWAQSRATTLLVAVEAGQNSLDPLGLGVNQATLGVTWNLYDRLVGFGTRTLAGGIETYDFNTIVPELAERWEVAADGGSITFHLRTANFHDGTPVTAADVKWSLDRAVANPVRLARCAPVASKSPSSSWWWTHAPFASTCRHQNPLALPDLAVIQPSVLNSALCRAHASERDPWALEWVRTNAAGSGAYKLESWTPRQETVLIRHDFWASGRKPFFEQVR